MIDNKTVMQQALDFLIESARLLGATQAKKVWSSYTYIDSKFEAICHEIIEAKTQSILDTIAQPVRSSVTNEEVWEAMAIFGRNESNSDGFRELLTNFAETRSIARPVHVPEIDCGNIVQTNLLVAAQAVLDRWNSPQWDWVKCGPTADLMQVLRSALDAQSLTPVNNHALLLAEAYQVVGSLLSDMGQFDTDKGRKVLDNLSQGRVVHNDVLPWPSFAKVVK